MPIMTRMRDSMPVILITLVVAFLLTIVFEWGMDYLGLRSRRADHVGEINGRTISYQEFSELVRQATENQKAQTKADPDENQLVQIRDQVWNSLITQTLVEEEIKRLGIEVKDEEIVDWVRGSNPPEFLKRQFTDSTGTFNRVAYDNALQNPKNKEIWITIEKNLRQQKLQEKLQSILLANVRATESEIFHRFVDQNVKVDVEYILFDPNKLIKDEEVNVTDPDIKKYYNEHSDDYKVDATRKLKYVFLRDEPSAQDTQGVLSDLEDIVRRTKEGADFVETASQYRQVQNSQAFFKHGELSPIKEEAVFGAKVGDIVGPLRDADGFHLIKIMEERQGKDDVIRASHILIASENNDSVRALKQAREVLAMAKHGQNFADLAGKFSKDPGSASRGGDLGWFGKGRMVKPFEEAAFKANVGQIVGPVRTQFGYHVIKVVEKSKREIRIADLAMPIKASTQTRSQMYQNAQEFSYLAKQSGFSESATQVGFNVSETPAFTKGAAIPGFGLSETLSKFTFNGKVGDISDVISLQLGYGVFMISEIKPAGIKPLEEVKPSIQSRVIREMKLERLKVLANEIHSALHPSDSLGKAVDSIESTHRVVAYPRQTDPPDRRAGGGLAELHVQRTGSFTPAGFVPGLGRDLTFIGAASSLNVGEISKPIEGQRGYYILKMLTKTPIDSAVYQAQRGTLLAQMTQEKRNRFLTEWLDQLKKSAEIDDSRDLFYR